MRNGTIRSLVLLAVFAVTACAPKDSVRPAGAPQPAVSQHERASEPRIEVVWAKFLAGGEYLEVRFKVFGMPKYDPEPDSTYVVDEATGQKFFIAWLKRIGRVATTKVHKDGSVQFIMIKNQDRKLKPGDRITVIIGPTRQEHVLVEEK